MPPELILVLMIVIGIPVMGVLSIPLSMIWTHHKRKMEELAMQRQQRLSEDIHAEFASLRAEIKALRDTTMQYDLSFDTSLQHIERRVGQLERQVRMPIGNTVGNSVGSSVGNEVSSQNVYNNLR